MNSGGIVFVISGPSGSGKGTVVEILRGMYKGAGVSVSVTSREPRDGERDGVNYYYKTAEEIEELIKTGQMLEYTRYNGNYYGTLKSEAERITAEGKDLILEIEVDGGAQIKRAMGDKCVLIMLTAPDSDELERRLRGRDSEEEDVILGRLARAHEEIKLVPAYDYVVVNQSGAAQECANDVFTIIRAEHMKSSRVADDILGHFWKD